MLSGKFRVNDHLNIIGSFARNKLLKKYISHKEKFEAFFNTAMIDAVWRTYSE